MSALRILLAACEQFRLLQCREEILTTKNAKSKPQDYGSMRGGARSDQHFP